MLMLMLLRARVLAPILTMLILMTRSALRNYKSNAPLSKLLVNALESVKEAQESHDAEARV
jgi:hypothetical protein